MAQQVSDFIVGRLIDWGIRRIYGYPGDGINGVMGALNRAKDKIDFIQVRHEEMAAFMACGHAKFTGEVGVCISTSGPGAIHLLNGLYDAKMDHQPVVAIVGQQARMSMGGDYQQEVDLASLFKDVAGSFVQQASTAPQVRHIVDRAVRIAVAERRTARRCATISQPRTKIVAKPCSKSCAGKERSLHWIVGHFSNLRGWEPCITPYRTRPRPTRRQPPPARSR